MIITNITTAPLVITGASLLTYTIPALGNITINSNDIPDSTIITLTNSRLIATQGWAPLQYVLPAATVSTLGGVKPGANTTVAGDGTLSVVGSTYAVMTATAGGAVPTPPNNANLFLNGQGAFSSPVTGLNLLAVINPTVAAQVSALNVFSSLYDNYVIYASGLLPGASDSLRYQLANSGVADTASNYSYTSTNASSIALTGSVFATGKGCAFQMVIENVNDPTNLKSIVTTSQYQTATGVTGYTNLGTNVSYIGGAISGIQLYWAAASNFTANGVIRIYGYRNS